LPGEPPRLAWTRSTFRESGCEIRDSTRCRGRRPLTRSNRDRDAPSVDHPAHSAAPRAFRGLALATEPTHLGSSGVGWLYSPGLLGKIRIRVTPAVAGSGLFVGIGRSRDVDRYLAGVGHTVISDFFADRVDAVAGVRSPAAPGAQRFWVAASSGPGERTVEWNPRGGSWTVVVMNANGKPGIAMRADVGARMPAVVWVAIGLLAAGAIFLAGSALLVVSAIRNERRSRAEH
jgi:hypothetical protein